MAASKTDLTVRMISERVHCEPETIRKWIRSGRLISRKIGPGAGRHRVRPQDLELFLDQR